MGKELQAADISDGLCIPYDLGLEIDRGTWSEGDDVYLPTRNR